MIMKPHECYTTATSGLFQEDPEYHLRELQRVLALRDPADSVPINQELIEKALDEALSRTMDWGYVMDEQKKEIEVLRTLLKEVLQYWGQAGECASDWEAMRGIRNRILENL